MSGLWGTHCFCSLIETESKEAWFLDEEEFLTGRLGVITCSSPLFLPAAYLLGKDLWDLVHLASKQWVESMSILFSTRKKNHFKVISEDVKILWGFSITLPCITLAMKESQIYSYSGCWCISNFRNSCYIQSLRSFIQRSLPFGPPLGCSSLPSGTMLSDISFFFF